MDDECVSGIKKILSELEEVKNFLDTLEISKFPDDIKNFKAMIKFKPMYKKLLNILEESKQYAKCPIYVLKPEEGGECYYQSPIEPLFLTDYADIPAPEDKYNVIHKIRRYAKENQLNKIKEVIDEMYERLKAVANGYESCSLDFLENFEEEEEEASEN